MQRIAASVSCVLVVAGLAGSACGGSAADCNPDCRMGFECFYGVCLPIVVDGAGDGIVDSTGDADAADEGGDAACVSPADCDDGDPCTDDSCDPGAGRCGHSPAADGTACADDGVRCTPDVCASGVCSHPLGPECCTDVSQCDDGDPCTDDRCSAGDCFHDPGSGCCTRDADCMSPEPPYWECDADAGTCYDPPAGDFCAPCGRRWDCGDGGSESDDWCVYYGDWGDTGCSKDCIDDLDCPSGATCFREDHPCGPEEPGCYCVVRVGNCNLYNEFGQPCMNDANCNTCPGCREGHCLSAGMPGYCTWGCDGDGDCRWDARCDGGYCVRR